MRRFPILTVIFTVATLYFSLARIGILNPANAVSNPTYGWTKTWGPATNESSATATAAAGDGNVYVAGYFKDVNVDFDPSGSVDLHSSIGNEDVYISKFDRNGVYLWTRTFGSTGFDAINDIATDSSGNIYATGWVNGVSESVDFDATAGTDTCATGAVGAYFVTRYNADGTYGWTKCLPADSNMEGKSIRIGTDAKIYVMGDFNDGSGQDFDPGPGTEIYSCNTYQKLFFQKYDLDGTYIWTKVMQDAGAMTPLNMTLDSSNNLIAGGIFFGSVDFDAGPGTAVSTAPAFVYHTFIVKYDSNGSYTWHVETSSPSSGQLNIYGMDTDTSGNIYLSGNFGNEYDFDPGPGTDAHTSNGSLDAFLWKLNSSGSYVWAKIYDTPAGQNASDLRLDSDGNLFVAGYFSGPTDFDFSGNTVSKSTTSDWGVDLFLASYDSDGNYRWVVTADGGQESIGNKVTLSTDSVYVAGNVYGSVNFDPEGAGDIQNGATDYGSSSLTAWRTVVPASSASPSSVASSAPSSQNASSPEAPTSAPIITSYVSSDTSVTLYFTSAGDPKTGYAVRYGTSAAADEFGANPIGTASSTSITVNGLQGNIGYYFVLKAVNSGTSGPESVLFYARTAPLTTESIASQSAEPNSTEVTATESGRPASSESPASGQAGGTSGNNGLLNRISVTESFSKMTEAILGTATPENITKTTEEAAVFTGSTAAAVVAVETVGTVASVLKILMSVYSGIGRSIQSLPFDVGSALGQRIRSSVYTFFPFFGISRRRKKGKGFVFDSTNSKPLPGAYVIFYSSSGNLKSDFTDGFGMYSVTLKKDTYEIRVNKTLYSFPSSTGGDIYAGEFTRLYRPGEKIESPADNTRVEDMAIALDPQSQKALNVFLNRLKKVISRIYHFIEIPIYIISAIFVSVSVYYQPNFITITSAIALCLVWVSWITRKITPEYSTQYNK